MKKLYKLVLNELFGPWAFGVAIFTMLIMTMTYLFQLTEWVVRGVSLGTVLYIMALTLPAILVKTFAMSVLLASLLAFGRLSGDSEVVALRAAGISIGRIMIPVGAFGLVVAILAFIVNETLAPQATIKAESLRGEIARQLKADDLRPVGHPIYDDNKRLIAQLNARDFSPATNTLRGVTMIVYDPDTEALKKTGFTKFYLEATEMQYIDRQEWKIRGGGQLLSADGTVRIQVGSLWPEGVPRPQFTPDTLIADMNRNLDSYSMKDYQIRIREAKKDKGKKSQVANLEYGYYNKMALPLAAFIFGLLGAPLGIRNHRAGVAAGYMIAIVIIFGYLVISNLMAVFVTRGNMQPWAASFTPVLIGFVVAAVTIHKRNV